MKKVICCALVLLFFCLTPNMVLATNNSINLPANTCPTNPIISACNLNYIMEANIASLTNLITTADKEVAHGIGFLYSTPPVSTHQYLSYMTSKFHVPGSPTPVYADAGGIGYSNLGPILKIWVVMRNLAYFFFAIIFVVTGMMILIRSKIDPKTTVTIQNALPKIIFSLVVVTFSYAIAGFLIDIMYVSMGLVITIAGSIDTQAGQLANKVVSNNIFFAFFDGYSFGNIVFAAQAINKLVDSFLNIQHNTFIVGGITNFLTGGIALLVLSLAILIALFKIWFALLSAYANIVLGIIFSPLQLMADAIPGQNQFGQWIRNMLGNLLAFPAVAVMIFIGLILSQLNSTNSIGPGFVPPLIGSSDLQSMQALIGIAIILTTPKAIEIVQDVIKAPKNKWGNAWNENITGAVAGAQGTGRLAYKPFDWKMNQETEKYQNYLKNPPPGAPATPIEMGGGNLWVQGKYRLNKLQGKKN